MLYSLQKFPTLVLDKDCSDYTYLSSIQGLFNKKILITYVIYRFSMNCLCMGNVLIHKLMQKEIK